MTQPATGVVKYDPAAATIPAGYGDTDDDGGNDAADRLSKLVAGNDNLITRPHLVTALYSAQATPEQAQAINQFVGGLKLANSVNFARASNTKINLTTGDKAQLDALGTDYSSVENTQLPTPAATQVKLAANVKKSGGGFSLGGIWGDVKGGLESAGSAVLSTLNKGWNLADQRLGTTLDAALQPAKDIVHGDFGDLAGDLGTSAEQFATAGNAGGLNAVVSDVSQGNFAQAGKDAIAHVTPQQAQMMRDDGYDPTNPLSIIAYQSSGKASLDVSDLQKKNPDIFDEAVKFANDPKGYQEKILGDQSLTTEQRGLKMNALNAPAFQNLATQINARRSSVGNVATQWINPVDHPELQQLLSGAIDTVASFVADPSNAAFAVAKAVKLAKLGLDGMHDTQIVTDALNGTTKGYNAANMRRGMQSFVDNVNGLRDANAGLNAGVDGSREAVAKAQARIRTMNPGLQHLTSEFLTGAKAVGLDDAGKMIYSTSEPIRDMAGATTYLASKTGLIRLMSGRATLEGRLMPGQMSAFGYRQIRGSLAAANSAHSVKKLDRVIDLNKPGVALRVMPVAGFDQVDSAGKTIAGRAPAVVAPEDAGENLASRARGQAGFESRTSTLTNNKTINTLVGFVDPGAVWARTKFAVQRATTTLPRSVVIDTGDPNSIEQIRQYSKMWLTPGDADLISGKYAAADEGGRKSIAIGMHMQVLHAAGLGTTEAGRQMIADSARSLTDESYSAIRGLDKRVDPRTGEERSSAIYATQVNPKLYLDKFTDIHKTAAKIGIWESTIGRAFQSKLADNLLPLIKVGWLFTGTNFARNAGEELALAATRGEFGDLLRAKAIAAHTDSARIGALSDHVAGLRKELTVAKMSEGADSSAAKEALRQTHGAADDNDLANIINKKIAKGENDINAQGFLPKRTALGQAVANFAPLARVGQMYRQKLIDTADESLGLDYIAKIDPDFAAQMAENWQRLHVGSDMDPKGVGDTTQIFQAGYVPVKLEMKRTGFGDVDITNDQVGSERFANALGIRINGDPQHADALMSHLESPDTFPIDNIVTSLKAPDNIKRVNQMTLANTFVDEDGVAHVASTDAEKEIALHQLANIQVQDMRYMLSNSDGTLNQELIDHIRDNGGKAPNQQWVLDHMTGDNHPDTVNAPMFEAKLAQGKGILPFIGALNDYSGKGYKWLVERPMTRVTTMPIFLANYGKSRYLLRGAEQGLIDGGLKPEAANAIMHQQALDRAFHRTVTQIDDPTLRTQMDVVGRNFFAFSRATTAFIRRWGTSFVEDPGRLRKAQMALEGGQKTGLVWTDQNGQMQFSYPGSGYTINAMMKVADLLPGVNLLRVPSMVPNLTGKVALLQPGVQNPLQFGLTPMVNMPFNAIEKLFPQHREAFDTVNNFFNDQNGADQPWYNELEPTVLKKFTDALRSDKDSMTADGVRSAILNLDAAGHLPPPDADAPTIDAFLKNVQVQTKNTLIARAMFGFFTPSPPGQPTDETSGSKEDASFRALGVRGLDAEFKEILNESGGDYGTAAQIWATMHPDKQFYTEATTTNATKSATFAATTAAQNWLNQNLGFMKDFNGVSAYFIPADTQDGKFDISAYNAELELGLRQHKTAGARVEDGGNQFYTDVRNANAATAFYTLTAQRDAAIAANPKNKSAITAKFTQLNKELNSTNPLWAASQQDYSTAASNALGQLSTLRRMVKSSDLPAEVPAGDVSQMITLYDQYHEAMAKYPGSTNAANAIHAQLDAVYTEKMTDLVNANSSLKGLYQGVFRSIDGKVLNKLGST